MVFAHYLKNCLSQSFYISHDDCFCENKSLVNLSSLDQRLRFHGSLLINYVNNFLLNIKQLLIIKPESTYPISIHEVTSCQSAHFYNMNLLK